MSNVISLWGQLSGAVGGIVWFKNRGGLCCRARVAPIQPDTPAQGLQKNLMGALATTWGADLTQLQRDAWDFFANQHPVTNKVGQVIKLTGQQMYMKINVVMLKVPLAAFVDPPLNLQVTPLTAAFVEQAVGGNATLNVEVGPIPSVTDYLYVRMAANVSPGISNANSQIVFAQAIVGDGIADNYVINVPAKFGLLVTGKKVMVTIQRLNSLTGGITPAVSATHTIT